LAGELSKRSFGPATAKYRELGTASNLLAFNRLAALPTRNFRESTFEDVEALAPETLEKTRERTRKSCASCTIGCEHLYPLADGRSARLEYENLFALGPLCGVGDPEIVLAASRACDDLGLDTISAGGTIAFAMECAERGLLDESVGESPPRFGDGAALLPILEKIARRAPGLGDLLAEGSRRAAERIGGGSIDFAPQVKGLEIPGYEPRALQSLALGFAVGTRGADHNKSGAYEADLSDEVDRLVGDERSAHAAIETENKAALMDSLILCKFVRGVFANFFEESATLLGAITGWDVTGAELRHSAARIVDLKKAFNIREGWTPALDTLPARFLSEGLPDGVARGARLPRERLQRMIVAYNRARGWSDDGHLDHRSLGDLVPENPRSGDDRS
ncbi:MAG: aldehyde ferredoxin oxidoreductase C-terminal domain-containing protein, partial [Planctomycetes bacterium]|nr:aldehyde ferredoxin oxidoreductase C-terminal domain-containing protein [Planctomycetota bacterium]